MSLILRLLFVVAVILVGVTVYTTSHELPARVATHFARGGLANGWLSHDGYVIFMLAMSTAFPLVVAGAIGFVPSAGRAMLSRSSRINTVEDLEEGLGFLGGAASLIGILICGLMVMMHFLVVEANQRMPQRLDESTFSTVLITFVVLLILMMAALALRFGSMRGPLRR